MPKTTRYPDIIVALIATALLLLLGYFVANRGLHIGSDTDNYVQFFNRVINGQTDWRYEIGFRYLTILASHISGHKEFYLFLIYAIVTACLYLSQILFVNSLNRRFSGRHILLAGLLLSSSWYNVATLNAFRQGIALSFTCLAIFLFMYGRRYFFSVLLFALSITFHISAALLPFVSLIFSLISLRKAVIFFAVSAAFYVTGVFEWMVAMFSTLSSFNLHAAVMEQADGRDQWKGVQWDQFIYTIFWPTLYLSLRNYIRVDSRDLFFSVLKIYMAFSIPYFVLGFGPMSNRFAILAWFILPILHFCFFMSSRFSPAILWIFSFAFLVVGIAKYGSFLAGWT